MNNLLTQTANPGGTIPGGLPGSAVGSYAAPFATFDRVLSAVIGFITVIAGLWFVFLILTGGISLMTAGGDKGAFEDARKRLMTGAIGLVVVIAGVFIADLLGFFLGLDILNPGTILRGITP